MGVGLLGGSLGLALKQRRLAGEVVGFVRRAASVAECERAGAVDQATLDPAEAVRGSELVIFCTPIARMRPLLEQARAGIERGAVITDVGSVKAPVVAGLEALAARAGAAFIGSHPMAGGEKTGVAAARGDLFAEAICVLTPTRRTRPEALRSVETLWREVGSRVLTLSPRRHDELVSRSSHLPHLLAAEIAALVLNPKRPPEQALLCANGFRDTTRIASGSPEMWRDIALANRTNLARDLSRVIRDLGQLRAALQRGDERYLERFLAGAKAARDQWAARAARSTSPE